MKIQRRPDRSSSRSFRIFLPSLPASGGDVNGEAGATKLTVIHRLINVIPRSCNERAILNARARADLNGRSRRDSISPVYQSAA